MSIEVEHVTFGGWEECVRVTNGTVELVATTQVGPRIVRFGFVDGRNELFVDEDDPGETGGDEWHNYGGHRLWHAPEMQPRTYVPDNDPIDYELTDVGCLLRQPTEELTGMRKEISVAMAADAPRVEVTHRLTNEGVWSVEAAPWAITVCEPGGTAVLPLSGGDPEALQPDRTVVLWPYTDPSDDRLAWAEDHLLVHQGGDGRYKVGTDAASAWAAYVNDGHALVKTVDWDPDATYPANGCGVEAFTLDFMLELETLGPLVELDPGETDEHVETWHLRDGIDSPTPDSVDSLELP